MSYDYNIESMLFGAGQALRVLLVLFQHTVAANRSGNCEGNRNMAKVGVLAGLLIVRMVLDVEMQREERSEELLSFIACGIIYNCFC